MADNIQTANPTLGDIVSNTSSDMPSNSTETPMMEQINQPQMPPVETVTE